MTWAATIAAGATLGSGAMGAAGQASVAREQAKSKRAELEESRRQFQARKAFAEQRRQLGGEQLATGEKQFLGEYAAAPQELTELKKQIAEGGTEGQQQAAKQTTANLELQGIRGPQAGLISAQAAGELGRGLTRDIAQEALSEAQQRRSAKGGYFAGKAQAGQQANLAAGGF